ncbi:MAG: protein-glutamate O-methyltransferase CheR, partial [Bacillota bacterium]
AWVRAGSYDGLVRMLRDGRLEPGALLDWFVPKVSRFFRDSDRFAELKRVHLPRLADLVSEGEVRVWSAGCSLGAEAYSVAMLLEDLGLLGGYRVLATDLSEAALEVARRGVYEFEYLHELSIRHFNRWVRPAGELWAVDGRLKERVEFRRHDLLSDRYPEGMHLLLCRNVLVYFEPEVRRRVLARLAGSLVPGGVLFLGAADPVPAAGEAGLRCVSPCFCVKGR